MSECKSINIALAYVPNTAANTTGSVLRIILYKDEVHRLARARQQIKVLLGTAWVTVAREDIILTQGEKMSVSTSDIAVVSPVGNRPLVLEQHFGPRRGAGWPFLLHRSVL